MVYTNPHNWQFQEQIDTGAASDMQVCSSNLSDLAGRAVFRNYACYAGSDHKVGLIHFGKWLYYKNVKDETAIIKPYSSDLGDDVSLSDVFDDGGGVVDLANAVDWMMPGMPFYVEGVLFAIQTESL